MDKDELLARTVDALVGRAEPGSSGKPAPAWPDDDPETERYRASIERVWRFLGAALPLADRPPPGMSSELSLALSVERLATAGRGAGEGWAPIAPAVKPEGYAAYGKEMPMTSEDWERYVEEMARKIAARRARLEEITVERREVDRQFERLAEERGIDLRQVRGMSVPDSATLDRASAQLLDDFQNRLRQSEMEIMAADSPGDSGGFVPGIRA